MFNIILIILLSISTVVATDQFDNNTKSDSVILNSNINTNTPTVNDNMNINGTLKTVTNNNNLKSIDNQRSNQENLDNSSYKNKNQNNLTTINTPTKKDMLSINTNIAKKSIKNFSVTNSKNIFKNKSQEVLLSNATKDSKKNINILLDNTNDTQSKSNVTNLIKTSTYSSTQFYYNVSSYDKYSNIINNINASGKYTKVVIYLNDGTYDFTNTTTWNKNIELLIQGSKNTIFTSKNNLALFNNSKNLFLYKIIIQNVSSVNEGVIINSGTLTIKNCTIINNVGCPQGVIHNNGVLNLKDSVFNSNYAGMGGAIYNNKTLIINNTIFSRNHAQKGGVICLDVGSTNTIIKYCEFFNNYSRRDGGAFYILSKTNITFVTCNFTKNYCENGRGGALWISFDPMGLFVEHCVFKDNHVLNGTSGGAICANANITTILQKVFYFHDTAFLRNYCINGSGGAILIAGHATIDSCIFKDNYNIRNGGVGKDREASSKSGVDLKVGGAILTIGPTIVSNVNFTGNYGEDTGAIALTGYHSTIRNCVFDNNSATGFSCGAFHTTGTVYIYNSLFKNNNANISGGALGVSRLTGNLFIYNSTITNNTALNREGGAIDAYNDTHLYIQNSIIINNKAGNSAGAIALNSGYFTSLNNTFENNMANTGGVIASNGNITIKNTKFINNKAVYNCGVIQINRGAFVSESSLYENNTITTNGNATVIYVNSTKSIDLFNNTFINNIPKYNNNHIELIKLNNVTKKSLINNTYIGNEIPIKIEIMNYTTKVDNNLKITAKVVIFNPFNYDNNLKVQQGDMAFQLNNETKIVINLNNTNTATLNYEFIKQGIYIINLKYTDLTDSYNKQINQSQITVVIDTILNPIQNLSGYATENIFVNTTIQDIHNKTVKAGIVSFYENGKLLGSTTVVNGEINYNLTFTSAGNHIIQVIYNKFIVYNPSNMTFNIKLDKLKTKIGLHNIQGLVNGKIKITAKVVDQNENNVTGGYVSFYDKNGTYLGKCNVKNGLATINTKFNTIYHNEYKAVYSGTRSYYNNSRISNITIYKVNTKMTINSVYGKIGENISLQANIKDKYGNNVTGGRVVFKINGKTISSKITVKNGIAKLNYIIPSSWYGKNITIQSIYSGTSNAYNSTIGFQTSVKVNK